MVTPSLFLVIAHALPLAVFCLGMYLFFRWQQSGTLIILDSLNDIFLLAWFIPLLMCATTLAEGVPVLTPVQTLFGVVLAWFFSLLAGAVLVRLLPPQYLDWQESIMFCAFYLAVIHLFSQVFMYDLLVAPLSDAWAMWARTMNVTGAHWTYVSVFLLWIFPLGAPASELIVRNFGHLARGFFRGDAEKQGPFVGRSPVDD